MPFNEKNEWRPTRKQEKFLALPTSIKEAAFLGGAGSGKSELLLAYPIIHRWIENPRFKQVFMRRTMPELKNEIVPRAKILYRPFHVDFNKSDMVFTFPSGAIVKLGHCEHEDDVHNYDSMEINLFTPDEITSYTEWQYLYIAFERVRAATGSGLPSIVRCAGMPGGIGHTWVKKRFIDPCLEGDKIIVGRGGNKRIFIFATQADNPYVDPSYKQSLEGLPEAEKQAKLYGSFDAYLGQVFEEFRDRKYPDEPDNALHVIEPFEIPEYWPRIVIGDWGYRAMTWIGFGAISPDARLYVYQELTFIKQKIEEWAPVAKEFIDKDNPRIVRFCKSAGQDRGMEHTIQQQIEDAIGRPIELSRNSPGSRIAGKILLHEYLRFKQKVRPAEDVKTYNDDYAQWILRNRTMAEYNSYLKSFTPYEEEKNLPKLQIFNTCSALINAIKACVYAKSREGVSAEDVAEFDGDDPYDGIRYMIDAADTYVNDAKSEFNAIQRREELLAKLSNDRDFTAFYRNARHIERSDGVQPVRRYHRASR